MDSFLVSCKHIEKYILLTGCTGGLCSSSQSQAFEISSTICIFNIKSVSVLLLDCSLCVALIID